MAAIAEVVDCNVGSVFQDTKLTKDMVVVKLVSVTIPATRLAIGDGSLRDLNLGDEIIWMVHEPLQFPSNYVPPPSSLLI